MLSSKIMILIKYSLFSLIIFAIKIKLKEVQRSYLYLISINISLIHNYMFCSGNYQLLDATAIFKGTLLKIKLKLSYFKQTRINNKLTVGKQFQHIHSQPIDQWFILLSKMFIQIKRFKWKLCSI